MKEVTETSEAVYGFERRDGFIRARVKHRKLVPTLCLKKCLQNLLQILKVSMSFNTSRMYNRVR